MAAIETTASPVLKNGGGVLCKYLVYMYQNNNKNVITPESSLPAAASERLPFIDMGCRVDWRAWVEIPFGVLGPARDCCEKRESWRSCFGAVGGCLERPFVRLRGPVGIEANLGLRGGGDDMEEEDVDWREGCCSW